MSSYVWRDGEAGKPGIYPYAAGKKKEFLEKEFILREERIKMHILVIGLK